MDAATDIARLLGISPNILRNIDEHMSSRYGKDGVLERIARENRNYVQNRLEVLGITKNHAHQMHKALLGKIKRDDHALFEYFREPVCDSEERCRELMLTAQDLADVGNGFFLKKEKARELLERNPPKNILSFFKMKSVSELLNRFDLFEVYSALRFVEDRTWLNTVFFKQIEYLSPDDFEERPIKVHVLHKEWLTIAEAFLEKKFHNVSHLKELGIIFVIPIPIDTAGETMRLFSLLLHYLHEITFYSKLFRLYAHEPDTFAKRLVSSLRGDVMEKPFPGDEQAYRWMMVQRYLAKEDEKDPRLFASHVNPEAIHWTRAENDIATLGKREKSLELEFWHGLDWVGAFIPDELGGETFTSFNLVDNAMSLVSAKTVVKYTYHHREALWNQVFSAYTGFSMMEELIIKNFSQGFIET
ncbi:MAG: hypothetical protein COU47_02930 [Candidatus Niyogibacteria bacterium CG10_big_fil_rev_8_21_14_0_10_46_36]|uniref:Uncharacterized protein n=1 Tax=Candidatus Niyogibacteria bacterium CG10_big_fil_rev_8_21_14_0_10_46_36 TaxID=1974726 RepID=A0A2H0TD77_9BACT|nr:MAG: hypothetical protein COU47_02930 [Candidatus Niyogibacteria bacterium CG10_big_fil_rev_8_21_14_0_10_46_36]